MKDKNTLNYKPVLVHGLVLLAALNVACSFGPVYIPCNVGGTTPTTDCCPSGLQTSCPATPLGPMIEHTLPTAGSRTTTASDILTCGAGNNALTQGSPFQGQGAYNESGVACGISWGTIQKTCKVTIRNCEGNCGGA